MNPNQAKPKRITIMCPAHALGDERVVCRQALTLAQAGHEVLVLARQADGWQQRLSASCASDAAG